MIFPIGDDQVKGGYKPIVTYAILIINIVVFIFQTSLSQGQLQAFVLNMDRFPMN